jgi:hypothetical protein
MDCSFTFFLPFLSFLSQLWCLISLELPNKIYYLIEPLYYIKGCYCVAPISNHISFSSYFHKYFFAIVDGVYFVLLRNSPDMSCFTWLGVICPSDVGQNLGSKQTKTYLKACIDCSSACFIHLLCPHYRGPSCHVTAKPEQHQAPSLPIHSKFTGSMC